jgi:hypothetical protein
MIIKAIKTTGLSITLAATFLVAAVSSGTFAQDGRGTDRDRDSSQDNRRDRDDRKDKDRDSDDRKDKDQDRDDRNDKDQDRDDKKDKDNDRDREDWKDKDNDRDRDDWEDSRWERYEQRRGYRDGLIRGREDALQYRRFNPFGYPRFRHGSSDYREGFRSGYARAYRRFDDDYGRRFGRRD